MSGRGSGNSRGGRGGRGNRGGYRNNKNKNKKKTLNGYSYQVGTSHNASDYQTTTDFIINYVKKTYDYGKDISTALQYLEDINIDDDKPELKKSNQDDEVK